MCIGVLPASMSVCIPHVSGTLQGIRLPDMEVTDRCKLPCRFWDSNPGPLEEHPKLLTSKPFP